MPDRANSILLVSLQFLFIALLIKDASLQEINILSTTLLLISVLLVAWAIVVMQKSKLRVSPIPSTHAILIINGPYRFIRHPMYTAILAGSVGLLVGYFTWIRLILFIALAIVLIIKLTWEEKMLLRKFEAYGNYKKYTSRLIPFLF